MAQHDHGITKAGSKRKRPARKSEGHPTKYRQVYCQMLIEFMAQGYSFEAFAGKIKVNQDTLHEWAKVQPEFSEAKKLAFSQNRLFWEAAGIDSLFLDKDTRFNASVWIFNMKNRFRWADRTEHEEAQRLQTVRIELPGAGKEQVISVEPEKIGEKEDGTSS